MNREWVCENCYAQNAAENNACRVCGYKVPAGVLTELKERSEAEEFFLPLPDDHKETVGTPDAPPVSRVANDRHLRRTYYMLTALWIVCLIIASVFLLTGQPIWTMNTQPSQFSAFAPSVIFEKIRSGYLTCGGRLFALSFQQVIDIAMRSINTVIGYAKSENVPWYMILMQSVDGLILLLSFLWMVRLTLRTALGVQNRAASRAPVEEMASRRKKRRFRFSCLMLPGEALVLDLLSLMLRRYSIIMRMLSFQLIALVALLAILVVQIFFKSQRRRSTSLETEVAQCLLAMFVLGMMASIFIL